MVDNAVTTEAFKILKNESLNATIEDVTEALQNLKIDSSSNTALEDKLKAALRNLGITNKCSGFVIDGDMAINMVDYFKKKKRPGSRSVRSNLKFYWHDFDFVRRVPINSCRMTS